MELSAATSGGLVYKLSGVNIEPRCWNNATEEESDVSDCNSEPLIS